MNASDPIISELKCQYLKVGLVSGRLLGVKGRAEPGELGADHYRRLAKSLMDKSACQETVWEL